MGIGTHGGIHYITLHSFAENTLDPTAESNNLFAQRRRNVFVDAVENVLPQTPK